MLNNSSNITINNCIFQYSKGQAVLLSEVSGDVSINHCNFVHNNCYSGHGAAIYYSSSNITSCLINDCNFVNNKHAESLVCTENKNSEHKNNITFHNIKFYHNQGVSIYAVNQNLYLNGKNLFWNNTAVNGAGIHMSDHSTVMFIENSNATFIQNFAEFIGGAIYSSEHSNVIFDHNCVASFNGNKAKHGGAIYAEITSNITFKATCKVMFINNTVDNPDENPWNFGGAIHACYVSFKFYCGV